MTSLFGWALKDEQDCDFCLGSFQIVKGGYTRHRNNFSTTSNIIFPLPSAPTRATHLSLPHSWSYPWKQLHCFTLGWGNRMLSLSRSLSQLLVRMRGIIPLSTSHLHWEDDVISLTQWHISFLKLDFIAKLWARDEVVDLMVFYKTCQLLNRNTETQSITVFFCLLYISLFLE